MADVAYRGSYAARPSDMSSLSGCLLRVSRVVWFRLVWITPSSLPRWLIQAGTNNDFHPLETCEKGSDCWHLCIHFTSRRVGISIYNFVPMLQGLGLSIDPGYSIVKECFPYLCRRLLIEDSPRMRRMLKSFLYGKDGDFLQVDQS